MTKIIPTVRIDPNKVKKALKLWHKSSLAGSPLSHLLVYQRKLREMDGNVRAATNMVLFDGINAMRGSKYKGMIHLRYIDGLLVRHIANQLNTSESLVYRIQRDAIELLTEELEAFENEIILSRVDLLDERLPFPTYQNLIGVEDHIEMLRPLLNAEDPPWIISLVGMGGIGKTSLADSLMRHSFPLGPFEQVAWVSAKPDYYHLSAQIKALRSPEKPAITVDELVNELLLQLKNIPMGSLDPESAFHLLEEVLKEEAHLIVIDNLETITDLYNLLPTLRLLSNPTRFVLTSRENLHNEPDVYHFSVPELSFESAVELIRQEAKWRNMIHLKPATKEELLPIYETVGGNPLVIYLIVGLTHVHPLHVILADLRQARSKKINNLYTYIYRRAWDNLDELERQILVQLPLISPSRSDLDFLCYITRLPLAELTEILDLLRRLNLIEVTGELGKRVYSISNLTRTFLSEQIMDCSIYRSNNVIPQKSHRQEHTPNPSQEGSHTVKFPLERGFRGAAFKSANLGVSSNNVKIRPLSDIVFDRCNNTIEAQPSAQTDEATEMLEKIGRLVRDWRLQRGQYRGRLAEELGMGSDELLCLEMGIATPEDVTEFQLRELMRMLGGSRQSKPFQEAVQRYLAVIADQQDKQMKQKANFW